MLSEAFIHQSNEILGSTDRIRVYYDFDKSSVELEQNGAVFQSYIKNDSVLNDGTFYGAIFDATGLTEEIALDAATGAGTFLENDYGNFQKGYISISGSDYLEIKDCSYLFYFDDNIANDSVLLGSFERTQKTVQGETVKSSNGFNFGINSRGKLYFQSLDQNGDYCFTFDECELSKKNVVGLNFGASQIGIHRFDYLNNRVLSQNFPIQTNHIRNSSNVYLGHSPTYWRSGESLYSGSMFNFVAISGVVAAPSLFELGKGLFFDYSFTSGIVASGQYLSGYVPTINYKTEVTGQYANITGYRAIKSGVDSFSKFYLPSATISVKEGERYYESFGSYLEEKGLLLSSSNNQYQPTGEFAYDTLGLQNVSGNVLNYSLFAAVPSPTTINVPLYEIVYLTGQTSEIESITNVAVFVPTFTTGVESSGVSLTGDVSDFSKNYLYFMGERI